MPSLPLESTHGRTTSGVAYHHHLWVAQTVERCRASHAIIALERRTRSYDVGSGMHHRLWAAHTIERRSAWNAIIALGRQTRSNDVRRDLPSPPLDSIHGRTMSGMACHHCLWEAHTVERRRAWHTIIAFGQYTWSNDVGRGIASPPLDSTHGRTTSGVACHHSPWTANTVERHQV